MKKNIIITVIALFFAGNIFGQDFNKVKICINPGHGGHDSNDRFISQTGFWESDGNLAKGLWVQKLLEEYDADVVMTRTTNTSADDLPLSQIVAIANSNNVDYFHAIHSNGYNGQSNYTLVLFQGFDNAPTYPNSKVMGTYVANEIMAAHRTTAKYVRGDFDFYGTGRAYLGVFKGLNMPGTLSEGSFHDYIPESFRLRNNSYAKHEAWAIVKAFISYYNLTPINTGLIAGVVRDPEQKVDYFSISGTGDIYQPINNVRIELEPGNKIYNGDDYNNGFFLFDSLAPGQYKVIYKTENYIFDSSLVTVTANKTTFADKYTTFDTTIAPIILSHSPEDLPDSIEAGASLKVSFNRIMNKESVQNAFKIIPEITGNFSWEDGDKTIVFKPELTFEKATRYKVSVSTLASSKWNVSIDSAYSFEFTTKNRDRIVLEKTYPNFNQNEISPSVQIRLNFDAPIAQSSLAGNINLYTSNGDRLSVKNVKIFTEDGKGKIYFEPYFPLDFNKQYKVLLGYGITDIDNLPLGNDVEINFTTESKQEVHGLVLDDFEQQNNRRFFAEGVNASNTNFALSTSQKISDKFSGYIKYEFNQDSTGNLLLVNKTGNDFSQETDVNFGAWIYGDNSNNYLKFGVSNDSTLSDAVITDSLNWTGWKFKSINVAKLSNPDSVIYYGIEIIKNVNGSRIGEFYLDDILYSSTTTDVSDNRGIVESYALFQNYPNPFNPSTNIKYNLLNSGKVSLKIYDMLGREVATLVNQFESAGLHSVNFNASKLSSGVYFYVLRTANFTSTKKLVLIK